MNDDLMGDSYGLEVTPKGAQARLVLYPKGMMQGAEQMKASIVFDCDDVVATYEQMKQSGVHFKEEPQ